MSIKVKHDGNATATAFASAHGGQGKRRQQDAASMASVMQQAANGGNQQLRGATASSSAPGKSSAPTIHAPLGSAPTPTVLPRGTYGGLRGGLGSGTGLGGATAGGTSRAASGVGAKSASGGGSRSDGSFFVNAAKADLIDAQRRQIENEERRKLQDSLFVESDSVFGEHSVDAYWDGSHWVRPYRPGEKEAIIRDQQMAVDEKYKMSAEGRKQMDALNGDIAQAVMSGRFSQAELDQLNQEADVAKKRIMYADLYRAKEPTAAETFAKNTYTDENGVIFTRDGSKVVYDPNANAQKMQEHEDTRYQNALLRLSQGYTVTEDQDGVSSSVRKQYTPDEQDAILAKMFPNRYPQNPNPPPSSGDPIVVSPFDPLHPENPVINPPTAKPAPAESTATSTSKGGSDANATPAQAQSSAEATPQSKWAGYADGGDKGGEEDKNK